MKGHLLAGLFLIQLAIVSAYLLGMSNNTDDTDFWRTDVSDGIELIYQIGEQIRMQREQEAMERTRRDPVFRQTLLPVVPTLLDPAHPTTVASLPVWVKWAYLVARRSIR